MNLDSHGTKGAKVFDINHQKTLLNLDAERRWAENKKALRPSGSIHKRDHVPKDHLKNHQEGGKTSIPRHCSNEGGQSLGSIHSTSRYHLYGRHSHRPSEDDS